MRNWGFWAASIAARAPAPPAPITNTSVLIAIASSPKLCLFGFRGVEFNSKARRLKDPMYIFDYYGSKSGVKFGSKGGG
jgi:hypothetical protein